MKGRKRSLPLLALVTLVLACESPFVRPDPDANLLMEFEIDSTPPVYTGQGRMLVYQAATVEVSLSETVGGPVVLRRQFPVREEGGRLVSRGSIPSLPPRGTYFLTARALEANGQVWTEGVTSFRLLPGERARVRLRLSPVEEVIETYPLASVDQLFSVLLPARRTRIFRLTVPPGQGGYYTARGYLPDSVPYTDLPKLGGSAPEGSFKEYQDNLIGGMVHDGQDLILAVHNPSFQPRDWRLVLRRDGAQPPESLGAPTLVLNYTGSEYGVDETAPVRLQFYPVPTVAYNASPPPLFTKTVAQTGPIPVPELVAYGYTRWAVRVVHDLDGDPWGPPQFDMASWHRPDRTDTTYLTQFSDVTTEPLGGPYPVLLRFTATPDPQITLGSTVAYPWKESLPTVPSIPVPDEPANNASSTAPMLAYGGAPDHKGFERTNDSLHTKTDTDWYQFTLPTYSDQYRLRLNVNYPVRVEVALYLSADTTTPLWTAQNYDAHGNWTTGQLTHAWPGLGGTAYHIRISNKGSGIGLYSLTVRLAEETTGFVTPPSPFPIDHNGWTTIRVSSTSSPWFSILNPHSSQMQFVVELDDVTGPYSRNGSADFPVSIAGGVDGPILNGYQSKVFDLLGSMSMGVSVTSPVIPGRLVRVRVRHWTDGDEPNDTASTAPFSGSAGLWRTNTFHGPTNEDWFRLSANAAREYLVQTESLSPGGILQEVAAARIQGYNATGNTQTAPIPSGSWADPDSAGKASLWIPGETPQIHVRLTAASGQTGAYRWRWYQVIPENILIARWPFNGSLANVGNDSTFTLSGTGYSFVSGGEGSSIVSQGAVQLDPAANGHFISGGALPIPTSTGQLLISFWIRPPLSGPDGSYGWILAQEDPSEELELGIELVRLSGQYRIRVCSGTNALTFTSAGAISAGIWNRVTVLIRDYLLTPGNAVRVQVNQSAPASMSWGVGLPALGFPRTLRLGSRAAAGTTLQAGLDDVRIYHPYTGGTFINPNDHPWLRDNR